MYLKEKKETFTLDMRINSIIKKILEDYSSIEDKKELIINVILKNSNYKPNIISKLTNDKPYGYEFFYFNLDYSNTLEFSEFVKEKKLENNDVNIVLLTENNIKVYCFTLNKEQTIEQISKNLDDFFSKILLMQKKKKKK